jgi:hypothetical protein
VVRKGFTKKLAFESRGLNESVMKEAGGKAFQEEGTANAKVRR